MLPIFLYITVLFYGANSNNFPPVEHPVPIPSVAVKAPMDISSSFYAPIPQDGTEHSRPETSNQERFHGNGKTFLRLEDSSHSQENPSIEKSSEEKILPKHEVNNPVAIPQPDQSSETVKNIRIIGNAKPETAIPPSPNVWLNVQTPKNNFNLNNWPAQQTVPDKISVLKNSKNVLTPSISTIAFNPSLPNPASEQIFIEQDQPILAPNLYSFLQLLINNLSAPKPNNEIVPIIQSFPESSVIDSANIWTLQKNHANPLLSKETTTLSTTVNSKVTNVAMPVNAKSSVVILNEIPFQIQKDISLPASVNWVPNLVSTLQVQPSSISSQQSKNFTATSQAGGIIISKILPNKVILNNNLITIPKNVPPLSPQVIMKSSSIPVQPTVLSVPSLNNNFKILPFTTVSAPVINRKNGSIRLDENILFPNINSFVNPLVIRNVPRSVYPVSFSYPVRSDIPQQNFITLPALQTGKNVPSGITPPFTKPCPLHFLRTALPIISGTTSQIPFQPLSLPINKNSVNIINPLNYPTSSQEFNQIARPSFTPLSSKMFYPGTQLSPSQQFLKMFDRIIPQPGTSVRYPLNFVQPFASAPFNNLKLPRRNFNNPQIFKSIPVETVSQTEKSSSAEVTTNGDKNLRSHEVDEAHEPKTTPEHHSASSLETESSSSEKSDEVSLHAEPSEQEPIYFSSEQTSLTKEEPPNFYRILPKPYIFGYKQKDDKGSVQHRQEVADIEGVVKGSYGYQHPSGLFRKVDYIADDGGFRAVIETNEPGTVGHGSADAAVVVKPKKIDETDTEQEKSYSEETSAAVESKEK